jgi:hypothetical protein
VGIDRERAQGGSKEKKPRPPGEYVYEYTYANRLTGELESDWFDVGKPGKVEFFQSGGRRAEEEEERKIERR